jgi:hypothetical protein
MDEAMKRAKKGDKRLLKYDPKYWEWISIAQLDMSDPHKCVSGQRFGDYNEGLAQLGINWGDEEKLGLEKGYALNDEGIDVYVSYEELDAAWTKIIAAHKEKQHPPKKVSKTKQTKDKTNKKVGI